MDKLAIKKLLEITKGSLITGSSSWNIAPKNISIDTRTLKKGQLFIAIKGKNFDGHDFIQEALKKEACGVIAQAPINKDRLPGLSNNKYAIIRVKDTVRCIGDIANYWRGKFKVPLIAITGSNGKTTTKEMTIDVLSSKFNVLYTKGSLNNQIGVPLTLLGLSDEHNIICVEMGTGSPGEITYLCKVSHPVNVGVITNIQRAHLAYFKNLDGVLKAKMELAGSLSSKGIMLINLDDTYLANQLDKIRCKVLTYGINNQKADIFASDVEITRKINFKANIRAGKKILSEQVTLPILGYHNIYNALTAIGIGYIYGIPLRESVCRLKRFKTLPLHLQIINIKGVKIINDTYNANPDSMKTAISTLVAFSSGGRRIAVIGDMLELGKYGKTAHQIIGQFIAESNVSMLFTVGKMASYTAKSALKRGLNKNKVFIAKDKNQVVKQLLKKIKKEDIILIKGSRAMKMEEIVKSLQAV